jgi:hypothetical protein
MLATLTAALLLSAPPTPAPPPAAADAPPASLDLFRKEGWYTDQKGKEQDFVGVLSKAAPPAAAAPGRFNPYRLTMNDDKGKQTVREVYVGAHPELLAPYVGRKIKLIGKPVEAEAEGQTRSEIWPAHLELLEVTPPPAPTAEVPDHIDLLINNKTYQADATPEKDYVGVLEKRKGDDAVGYRLLIDAKDHIDKQDLHLFDQRYSVFDPYAGLRVKITGKKVSGEVRGVPMTYILPAQLAVVTADKPGKELKILAKAEWRPVEGAAPLQLVIRSPAELAKAHGQPADRATDTAVQNREAELAARMFNVETIDFDKKMIVVVSTGAEPTTGYNAEVTRLDVQDDVLTVHWRVIAPGPGAAVKEVTTNNAQAVLTDRFEGKVAFDLPPTKAPPPPPPGR